MVLAGCQFFGALCYARSVSGLSVRGGVGYLVLRVRRRRRRRTTVIPPPRLAIKRAANAAAAVTLLGGC